MAVFEDTSQCLIETVFNFSHLGKEIPENGVKLACNYPYK